MLRSLILPAACFLVLLSSCGSSKGGSYLYDQDSAEPKLLDSEIRMETQRFRRGGPGPDVRSISCNKGQIKATYRSPALKEEGEAEIPFEDYAKIWSTVVESTAWVSDPEATDPQGGLYHFIRYRMGTRVGETSAQDRSNFLGIGTANIHARLELANAITDLCSKYIKAGPLKQVEGETETP